jgi:hypothetical protein
MLDDKLTITYDEQFQLATLRLESTPPQQCSLLLREGFSLANLHEALIATGWARFEEQHYRLDCHVRIDFLADVLSNMLNLFDAPEQASRELLAVRAAVTAQQGDLGSDIAIPDLALAWLDVIVREDIADEARSSEQIWSQSNLSVECLSHRERRIKELLVRYAQPTGVELRLAPSTATRSAAAADRAKSG